MSSPRDIPAERERDDAWRATEGELTGSDLARPGAASPSAAAARSGGALSARRDEPPARDRSPRTDVSAGALSSAHGVEAGEMGEAMAHVLATFMAELGRNLTGGPVGWPGRAARRNRRLREAADALRASPVFDEEWYLARYHDVAEAGIDPAQHFIEHGYAEGRAPNAFMAEILDSGGAVARAGGANSGRLASAPRRTQRPARSFRPAQFAPRAGSSARLPHYGEIFHALVEACHARMEPEGSCHEYDAVREAFDVGFYLARYQDIARAPTIDPVRHYLRAGAREGRDPTPDFGTKTYIARYREEIEASGLHPFHHYLKIGRPNGAVAQPFEAFDDFAEMLGLAPEEADRMLAGRRADMRARLEHGKLGEMVAKACEIDPLVGGSWTAAMECRIMPFTSDGLVSALVAMRRLHEAAQMRPARFVILVNRPRWGAGRRAEGHLAHALAADHGVGEVLVVYTDEGGTSPAGRLPEGCREVDFATIAGSIKKPERIRLLVEFVRSLGPSAAFNVNSRLFWDALVPHGKALAYSIDLYGYLFCNEKNLYGDWTGYPLKNVYRHFDVLAGLLTDSHALAQALRESYSVPENQKGKIRALEAPADLSQPLVQAPVRVASGRRVFWAGRFDRQKRVDIALAVADLLPDVTFHLWGEPVIGGVDPTPFAPPNVVFEGVYDRLADIPLHACNAWLYTSEWDGVPQLLLEVCMTGIPVVGALAGGTGELLDEETSFPVRDVLDPQAYAAGLRTVLDDEAAARDKARRLRERLAATRTPENYAACLRAALGGAG